MDSACLHARTLFEFFTRPTGNNYYGLDALGMNPLRSALYTNDWAGPLHSFLMHAQDRSKPRQLKSFDPSEPSKDLNRMPVDFAEEVVRLWREMVRLCKHSTSPSVQALELPSQTILDGAIARAKPVVTSRATDGPPLTPLGWP